MSLLNYRLHTNYGHAQQQQQHQQKLHTPPYTHGPSGSRMPSTLQHQRQACQPQLNRTNEHTRTHARTAFAIMLIELRKIAYNLTKNHFVAFIMRNGSRRRRRVAMWPSRHAQHSLHHSLETQRCP